MSDATVKKRFSTQIKALARRGKLSEAMVLLDSFASTLEQDGDKPDPHSYTVCISGCLKVARPLLSLSILDMMQRHSVEPNIITYNAILNVLGKAGKIDEMWKLVDRMESDQMVKDVFTYTILIRSCARRPFERSTSFFSPVPKIPLQESLEQTEIAYSLYAQAKNEVFLNAVLYGALLMVCLDARDWDSAIKFLDEAAQFGISINSTLVTIAAKIARKCGGDNKKSRIEILRKSAEQRGISLDSEALRAIGTGNDRNSDPRPSDTYIARSSGLDKFPWRRSKIPSVAPRELLHLQRVSAQLQKQISALRIPTVIEATEHESKISAQLSALVMLKCRYLPPPRRVSDVRIDLSECSSAKSFLVERCQQLKTGYSYNSYKRCMYIHCMTSG